MPYRLVNNMRHPAPAGGEGDQQTRHILVSSTPTQAESMYFQLCANFLSIAGQVLQGELAGITWESHHMGLLGEDIVTDPRMSSPLTPRTPF